MEQLTLFEVERRGEPDGSESKPARRAKVAPTIPAEIIVAAVELMGAIDLDPYCVNESTTLVPAKVRYGPDDKARALSWGPKRCRVFLVPPAGRATASWMNKLCDEYEAGNVAHGIAYLKAALDSEWWERLKAFPMCVVHRQLRVAAGSHAAPGPWVVVYFGVSLNRFAEAFGEIGMLFVPYRRQVKLTESDASQQLQKPEIQAAKEQESKGTRTLKLGEYVVAVNASACYFTVTNLDWDKAQQDRLRQAVLDIPDVLPRQYSSVSKGSDGSIKLIFSFKKGRADEVVAHIKKMMKRASGRSK